MKIVIAEHRGFCFGVERAIKKIEKLLHGNEGINYSIGPPIHNPQTIEKLRKEGLRIVNRLEEIEKGRLIVRAHGLSPQLINQARDRNIEIVDTTCPFVKKAQERAYLLNKDGYAIIVVGEKAHPEVQSIIGVTSGNCYVVEKPADLDRLNLTDNKKIGVLAQTTQSNRNFQLITDKLISENPSKNIEIFNTICQATATRQEEAGAIAERVDLIIVLGGKISANTKRLAKICRDVGTDVHHIETAGEIEPSWFERKNSVGLVTGTSTPEWIIKETTNRLEKY